MCTSPTVLPALRLEHVQSKSSAQRLSDGKKLPTVKIQSRREGKAEANKRVGISKTVMSGVNQGRTSNQSKTLFRWLPKGNSLKDSSTNSTRTSQVGAGSGGEDYIMGWGGRGGSVDSGHDGSDIGSNYNSDFSGVGAGGKTGSDDYGSGDHIMDTSDSGAGGSGSGIAHIRGTGNSGYSGGVSGASVAPIAAVDRLNPMTDLAPVITVVAASTAPNVSSVAFAASAGANDNSSGWGDFEKPFDMLLEEELEMWKEKENDSRTSNLKWK